MSIIMVSRGSYSRGKEIAEKLAACLGYARVSRDSLIKDIGEVSPHDTQLLHSIEDIPSIFSRFRQGKETYIAYIQATLLQKLKNDNVVYEGFVGHVFLKDIPNVLKVRIISDYEDRAGIVAERDGIPRDQALKLIRKIDEQRKKWSQYLYGIDPSDASQYDVTLNVTQIPLEAVVDTLAGISALEQFQMTAESRRKLENLALAAEFQNALLRTHSGVRVTAEDGKVLVNTELSNNSRSAFISEVEQLAKSSVAVREVEVGFEIPVLLTREKVTERLVITP